MRGQGGRGGRVGEEAGERERALGRKREREKER
jgi:hypothetical protein